jgi:hypothetical protein
MPPLAPLRATARTSTALIHGQPALKFPLSFRATQPTRTFSQTATRQGGGGHGSQYDPPSGWLFGVKPGEKYQKEGWEGIWYWGFYGSFALATIAYAFKPDTRYVLCDWADWVGLEWTGWSEVVNEARGWRRE